MRRKGSLMNTKSRVAGAFIGLAVGDALGVPLERMEKGSIGFVSEMIGGGPYKLPPGAWTDETATALCLAQSLLVTHELNVYDLVETSTRWVETGENASTGVCIGIEQKLLTFLSNFKRSSQIDMSFVSQAAKGNSVLARVAPIACIHWADLGTVSRIAKQQSYLTHSSEIVAAACEYLVLSVSHLIAGRDWNYVCNMPIKGDWPTVIKNINTGHWKEKLEEHLQSTDDVIDILETSFWCIENSENFEDAVTKAVNLGGNADTVGSVVGQMAGAMYGLEAIPVRWFDQLFAIEKLTDIAMEMVDLSRSE